MTKADLVAKISEKLGIEKGDVQATVESFMEEVKTSLESGDNVYLRGFGSFIIKTRAEKTGRNISKNTTIKIPAHNIPAFKPAKVFVEGVKTNVEVKQRQNKVLIQKTLFMPSGKKRKRHKVATHKRKKRRRANRHKKKKQIKKVVRLTTFLVKKQNVL
eukprot:TRINITY_DN19235_c0_g1_i3.p2 TRINITY_DN19235_c0_g1~~TRINITY_DN19235_c0_g1_i3.p2  ORF type:complete len:159 (-),score=14.46 TRINITY_DN19235_c0_g1_i3:464-940(-)